MDKEREAFETWLFSTEKFKFRNKNFLFMLDEYGNYEDKPVLEHWETWQAAKSQAVTEKKQFNLDEFLAMEEELKHKGGVIKADLDRFIAYAEMVLIQAKALKESK